jgi:4-carboxymuconolactone decarboxylase
LGTHLDPGDFDETKFAMAVLTVAGATAQAADRFPILTQEQLAPDQAKLVKQLLAGPRGGGDDSAAAVTKLMTSGPFNAWARSPDLGDRLQKVGEYIRFNSSIPLRLNEFAILITARHWTSQYEWFAHLPLGLKAGLDPQIAAELAQNQRPSNMQDDEAVVYDFCTELHRNKNVSDATYKRATAMFGEKGVVDLIGVCGYYTAVSMTLNVADVKLPAGEPNPLPPLK